MIGRRKPRKDPVSPETREFVLRRDRECIRAKLGDLHECRDQWGMPHRADDLDKLTLDHVHETHGMMGKRAPSDPAHLVSVCFASHLYGWSTSKDARAAVRWYLHGRAA